MTKACAVTTTLYIWSSPISDPGWPSSDVPTIPDQAPKMKYKVPMSLRLVENNHRLTISRVAEVDRW
jgi:hypothetical protein